MYISPRHVYRDLVKQKHYTLKICSENKSSCKLILILENRPSNTGMLWIVIDLDTVPDSAFG